MPGRSSLTRRVQRGQRGMPERPQVRPTAILTARLAVAFRAATRGSAGGAQTGDAKKQAGEAHSLFDSISGTNASSCSRVQST
jgi:hypothetical protein